jgi:hypothetical protein
VAATTLVSALAYDFFKVSQELHAWRTLMRIEAIEAAMAEACGGEAIPSEDRKVLLQINFLPNSVVALTSSSHQHLV